MTAYWQSGAAGIMLLPQLAFVFGVGFIGAEIAERSLHVAADICVYTNHNVIVEEIG